MTPGELLLRPDVENAATRRQFLALMAAGGLLTACGDDDDASPAAASTPRTRQVPSDNGPVTVPSDPKRVVAAIGSFETDMVAVGITPVLTTSFAGPWVDLGPDTTITENIPPTAEELLLAEPDLIVGWNWVTKKPGFDRIAAVAPYVGLGETAGTAGAGWDFKVPMKSWDTLFLSVCDAVGRRARGLELVQELEASIDDLARRRAEADKISVARIEFYEPGTFSWRGQNEDTAELMRRIGLEVVGPDESEQDLSVERLPEVDADWVVIPVGGGSMPRTSTTRSGYLWAVAMVEDLDRLFGFGDPSASASPSPTS